MNNSLDKFKVRFKKREIIFCEYELGEEVYFILNGKVRLVKVSNQKQKTLATMKKGDIFGEMAMLEKMPRSATCLAETDVELLVFNQESFLTLVQKNPSMGIKLIKNFAERIDDQRKKLSILLLENKASKILSTLIMLYERGQVEVDPNKKGVKITTSIESIQDWTNLSLSEVQSNLDFLKNNKILKIEDNGIVLMNLEYIKNLIEKEEQKIN